MSLNITIHETVSGDLIVKEPVCEDKFYDNIIPFKKSVSVSIVVRKTSKTSEILKAFIHNHKSVEILNTFNIIHDGWYEVIHFVIPTLEYVNTFDHILEGLYASDGTDIFQYHEGQMSKVDINNLLEESNLKSFTTAYVKKSIFILYNLWQCYFNYCKRMLESECSKDTKCFDCNDEGFKNRSLIWIFLNAIEYYVYFGELQAAQELLENISGCNTLCTNEMFSKLYDCGCGK